jgi:hypothetical protein
MRLQFEPFDGRSSCFRDVIDVETGKTVGFIQAGGVGFGNTGGIEVSLFDGKYRTEANRFEECWGFVRSVQAVLNHMVHIKELGAGPFPSSS